MIITFTANPSLDRTVTLASDLVVGGVHRIVEDTVQPGGKGINVALAVGRADLPVLAVLPAPAADPLLGLLETSDMDVRPIPVAGPVRTNIAVLAGGETTKINEPGATLSEAEVSRVNDELVNLVEPGDTVMLSGSLAPGFPKDEYSQLIQKLRPKGVWVGVDTSDAPLQALAQNLTEAAPDFMKPNAEELGQITGRDGVALEAQAKAGDLSAILEAAQELHKKGVGEILVTLGGAGAVLVTKEGAWFSPSPDVQVISTVGAGDSATAGYLVASAAGLPPAERLAYAVAYGAAAASMPGTTIPRRDEVSPSVSLVTQI